MRVIGAPLMRGTDPLLRGNPSRERVSRMILPQAQPLAQDTMSPANLRFLTHSPMARVLVYERL